MTHICVSKLSIIGSDNGLSPGRRQAIIRTNDGMLLFGPLRTNFSKILSKIHIFSLKNAFENIVCEMASIFTRPQCVKPIQAQPNNNDVNTHIYTMTTSLYHYIENLRNPHHILAFCNSKFIFDMSHGIANRLPLYFVMYAPDSRLISKIKTYKL